MERIAVVGGGVAGLYAAHRLSRRFHVTLFESSARLGGHTNTRIIGRGPDEGTAVDTGFITLNENTYPFFMGWLEQLGVPTRISDMSFGYQCQLSGLSYGGHSLNTFFAQRGNLLRPDFLRMASEVARFNREGSQALRCGAVVGTLGQWSAGYSDFFRRHYLIPLGAAIWSTPPGKLLNFPASTYLRFFLNHGLLSVLNRPVWRTVVGGSHSYILALRQRFPGEFRLGQPVLSLRRGPDSFTVVTRGREERFDWGIIATHADQALALLGDPDPSEQELLGAWRYQENLAVLHTDVAVLPHNPLVQASWNYVRSGSEDAATLTYDMNRLQGLNTVHRYLVTLNPQSAIDPAKIHGQWSYHHPQYDQGSLASQRRLASLNGKLRTFYCGSYFGYGFHEDAVVSAFEAAQGLENLALPQLRQTEPALL